MTEFIKNELSSWKNYEIIALTVILFIIIVNALINKDSAIAVCSTICGILYTVIAGKGKISCYFFGLAGSGCYIALAFISSLWGNLLLYLLYFIPMQVIGVFKWKKHLYEKTKEIIKIRLSLKERILLIVFAILGCSVFICILSFTDDKNFVTDGITTFLSILGMYMTVRRAIEQWIIWIIVNGLSFLMWLNIISQGIKAYSTLIMWLVYFALAIYFYVIWKNEMKNTLLYKSTIKGTYVANSAK